MNSPVAPGAPAPALRLQRPGWRDPRLVIGVLLVAGSVALGSWTVRTARQTAPVLAAVADLPAGHVLVAEDLEPVEVALGRAADRYVGPGAAVAGAVLARPVRAGELLPGALLVPRSESGLRTVAVHVAGPLPGDVVVGGLVDVWLLPGPDPDADAAATEPRAVALGLDVTAVEAASGTFGSGLSAGTTVEVRVDDAELPTVLGALAADGEIALVASSVGPPVPATGPAPAASAPTAPAAP